jgi:hypothetical protein
VRTTLDLIVSQPAVGAFSLTGAGPAQLPFSRSGILKCSAQSFTHGAHPQMNPIITRVLRWAELIG